VDALTFEQARQIADPDARALRTGMTTAAAIGVHNLGEGLAIGVAAGTGKLRLATVLVIGFALHNATEEFGIVGPLLSLGFCAGVLTDLVVTYGGA
jgi:zinc transporter, ZIP family